LIEDNPADVDLIREALLEHSVECELILIKDGERAIAFVESLAAQTMGCPDLIILDLNLPRMSGREVLKHVRATSFFRGVPVVVLTSSNLDQDRAEAERLGASLYVQKPSRLTDFMNLGGVFKRLLDDPAG
jgi:CheY-like chemotaxis protein